MTKILFVCTGNICRSPTAEGAARAVAEKRRVGHRFHFDSAGTHAYHTGEPPDRRAIAAAKRRGYALSELRARPVQADDFVRFDHLLALDRGHLAWLEQACPPSQRHKLRLLMQHSTRFDESDVPDPYYGGPQDFERVLDLVEDATEGLIGSLMPH